MKILDEKFLKNTWRYLFQCAMATAAVLAVLLILNVVSEAAVIAALGASSFIAFTMPHANVSRPRYLVGGYVVAGVAGLLCWFVSVHPWLEELGIPPDKMLVLSGGAAVGLAMFLMVVTDTEHPPAAGFALGLAVMEKFSVEVVLVAVGGVVLLSVIKRLLKPVLINLL